MKVDTRTIEERIEALEQVATKFGGDVKALHALTMKQGAVLRAYAEKCDEFETLFTFTTKPKDKDN